MRHLLDVSYLTLKLATRTVQVWALRLEIYLLKRK